MTIPKFLIEILFFTSLLFSVNSSGEDDSVQLKIKQRRDFDVKSQPFMERQLASKEDYDSPVKYRLPKSVVPYHYNLEIVPILSANSGLGEQFTAPGNVKILVQCVEETSSIVLHAYLLKIYSVKVNIRNGGNVDVTNHTYDTAQRDFYRITLATPLKAGKKYEINIEYLAPVSGDRADGLYRSSYKDPKTGETRFLASTQFESFYARQAFPSFDEPAFKATFDTTIGRSEIHSALSNTELISTRPMDNFVGWYWDSFNTTVPMSTYLVAFVVSEYTYAEADRSLFHGKPVRVYGPEFVIEKGAGNYSADAAAKFLTFYENYLEIDYPLAKMDSVMDPGFQHGAMENWGLNIYRDRYLAVIPGVTTEHQRASVSSIVAHELAHQWFGNLVTCSFWQNIWLNEGFATYYSYIAVNHTFPEFEAEKGLVTEALQTAFRIDARDTTYSILLDTDSPYELERRVGGIPYMKGAALVRMMDSFLSRDVFHTGVKKYLRKWAYKAAEQDDLFDVLTEVGHQYGTLPADLTVNEIMSSWTKQKGFPIVKVSATGNNTVYLIQDAYRNDFQTQTKYYSWHIPITIATEDNPNFTHQVPKFWMRKGVALKTYKHDTTKWIVVNPGATSYYRVLYDEHLTGLLQKQFLNDYSVISAFSRSQILDDYLSLAFKKEIPYGMSLEFTKYMGLETDDMAWDVLLGYLGRLFYFYDDSENFTAFKGYILPKIHNVLTQIGYEQKSEDRGSLVVFRARLLNWACTFGHPTCLEHARNLIKRWEESPDNNTIPIDQTFMYCAAVSSGGNDTLKFILQRIEEEVNVRRRHYLVSSLGCVRQKHLIENLLNSLVNTANAERNSEDVLLIFRSLAANPLARRLALTFVKENTQKLIEIFSTARHIDFFLYTLTDHLHTEESLYAMQDIIQSDALQSDERLSFESYVSEVKNNIVWMKKHYFPMKQWFEAQTSAL